MSVFLCENFTFSWSVVRPFGQHPVPSLCTRSPRLIIRPKLLLFGDQLYVFLIPANHISKERSCLSKASFCQSESCEGCFSASSCLLSGVFEVETPFKFEQKGEICRQTATQLWQQQETPKDNFNSMATKTTRNN